MKKKYDPNYENGYCPYGFIYVEGHVMSDGTRVDSYCRKLPKHRFGDPDLTANRNKQQMERQSGKAAEKAYSDAHGNFPSETDL